MVVLEETPGRTAMAAIAHESALPVISLPNSAADVHWDVSATGFRVTRLYSLGAGSKFAAFELFDQGFECSIEYLGDIAVWNGMAE